MDISQATRVAQVIKGTSQHERFERHIRINQPIPYYERGTSGARAKHKILGKKDGLPGESNYYLKLL